MRQQLMLTTQWLAQTYNRLRISRKLAVSFGVLLALMFVMVGRNYVSHRQVRRELREVRLLRFPATVASENAHVNLLKMLSGMQGYLATGESQFRDDYQEARQNFEQNLNTLSRLLAKEESPAAQRNLQELQRIYQNEWILLPEELFSLRDDLKQNQPAFRLFAEELDLPLTILFRQTSQVIALQEARSPSTQNMQLLGRMTEFKSSLSLAIASLRSYLSTRSPAFRYDYGSNYKISQDNWKIIQEKRYLFSPEQQQLIDKIALNYQVLEQQVPGLFAIIEGEHYREDLYLFTTQAEPIAQQMIDHLDGLVDNQQQSLKQGLNTGTTALNNAQWQNLLGGAIALGISSGMIWLLRQKITQPIQRLTDLSQTIAEGNLEVTVPVESQDEIGTLATTFNEMTQSLQRSRQTLKSYNQVLERKVEERTQELQEQNLKLEDTLKELNLAQSQLIQNEKMSALGQLVAGVAHEINNPINFISGNLRHLTSDIQDLFDIIQLYQMAQLSQDFNSQSIKQVLAEKLEEVDFDFMQQDIPKMLASMELGCDRIQKIVISLRHFSRLDESGFKQIDLQQAIEDNILLIRHRLTQHNIKLTTKYPPQHPLVECYAGPFNQAIMNILFNAIEAMVERKAESVEDYQPHLEISLEAIANEYSQVTITDNGNGIAADLQQRIFEPFFTTKVVGRGTGMGLAVCYQIIVEQHKGKIELQSELGQGSTFSLTIPLSQFAVQQQVQDLLPPINS